MAVAQDAKHLHRGLFFKYICVSPDPEMFTLGSVKLNASMTKEMLLQTQLVLFNHFLDKLRTVTEKVTSEVLACIPSSFEDPDVLRPRVDRVVSLCVWVRVYCGSNDVGKLWQ